jgi:hypothetical protein
MVLLRWSIRVFKADLIKTEDERDDRALTQGATSIEVRQRLV